MLSLPDGTILLRARGQPMGFDPKSYLSEIAAMIAALRIVKLLNEFENEDAPIRIDFWLITDSEIFIKQYNALCSRPTFYKSHVLKSEYDLLIALVKLTESMPEATFPMYHVKSHQDDDKNLNIAQTSLPIRLNIEADKQATLALQSGTYRPAVSLDPLAVVQTSKQK